MIKTLGSKPGSILSVESNQNVESKIAFYFMKLVILSLNSSHSSYKMFYDSVSEDCVLFLHEIWSVDSKEN